MSIQIKSGDVTDTQRSELELFRQVQPFLRQCLALNHEIGNSLVGIMGYSELLMGEADKLSDDARRSLRVIGECAERIKRALEFLGEEKIALAARVDLEKLTTEPDTDPNSLHKLVGFSDNPLDGQRADKR